MSSLSVLEFRTQSVGKKRSPTAKVRFYGTLNVARVTRTSPILFIPEYLIKCQKSVAPLI